MLRRALFGCSVIVLAGPVLAADLPAEKGPPIYTPPPPPTFTWTGVYIGGQVGYDWGRTNWNTYDAGSGNVVASQPSNNPDGVVGGLHIGYNWQVSQFVLGLEGDVNGSSFQGSILNNSGTHSLETRIDIDGSIRGRIGYAWDRLLIYGTGGIAFAPIRTSNTNLFTGYSDSYTHTLVGWTVGGGVEYALDNNWSVRAEYRYTNYTRFSGTLYNSVATPGGFGNRFHVTDNLVQAGFSYKFDLFAPAAPVVAKY